jgi:hypothetical protein
MWSLSLEEIQQVKEELKGRRDALRVKYDEEVQALEADIANIETLELAASLFVARYRPEDTVEGMIAELEPAAPEPVSDGQAPRNWRALLDRPVQPAPTMDDPR